MRLRMIAAAFLVAAPILALENTSAAACFWDRGYGYGYAATSYGYSSPAYYGGYRGIGWRRGFYGYRGIGVGRGLYGYRGIGVGRVGYRGVGVGRVGVGRV